MSPSELVRRADGALLQSVPVSTLARANITSLGQVENKRWRLAQVRLPNRTLLLALLLQFPPSYFGVICLSRRVTWSERCADESSWILGESCRISSRNLLGIAKYDK